MADEHDAKIAEPCQAGSNGSVVAKSPVTVQFHEVVEKQFDVVQGLRPLRMAGYEHRVPGVE